MHWICQQCIGFATIVINCVLTTHWIWSMIVIYAVGLPPRIVREDDRPRPTKQGTFKMFMSFKYFNNTW